jgi:uncharacterized repeat protein (TIGR01451 family)
MKSLSLVTVRIALFALALALARAVSAQNFTLTLQPGTVTLIPNQHASFLVSLTPLNGFTSQVALAVETLPSGVTAQFSPPTLTPPGTSILSLSAATNAALGLFTLNISASGGGITNTTSSSVTVNFGLLPICTGAFQGQVTDQTGLPVAGATASAVYYSAHGPMSSAATADTNGMYIMTNVMLAPDNQPALYSLTAPGRGTDYWQSASISAYAVCGATNPANNLQLLRKQTGSVSGQVVVQGGGPLAGVVVSGAVGPDLQFSVTTDTNGAFQSPALQLNPGNAPIKYGVYAMPSGYWQSYSNIMVQANSNSVVTLTLVPICTGTVHGQVVFADSGLPATNVTVTLSYERGFVTNARTDSNGNYTITNLSLGFDNTPLAALSVGSTPTGYNTGTANSAVSLSACGQTLTMPVLALQPLPRNNYGDVAGHVYDLQSGQPITNAAVVGIEADRGTVSAYTDRDGAYYLTNLLVGVGNATNLLTTVNASAAGYFYLDSYVTVYASQVVTQDVRLLLIGHGAVAGTVRDSASTLPVPGALVYSADAGQYYTDANGHYATVLLPLSRGNIPTAESFFVSADGYWPASTNTTITQGHTNLVDVNLIKVCSGATILGNVVDALTQKPITNATVATATVNGSAYWHAMTDANGSFILTNITVGNGNSPIQSTLTATAPGYQPQSQTVTIFCNATIMTQFGVPQTVFGGIDGYVTNAVTGLPLTNVFIGTGFGAATTTDTNGYYNLSQVPLGANGASRVWTVTAIPNGFPAQTESVAVSSNVVSRLDFGFGQPPTALIVTATGAPEPVTVGSNLVYLVTLTNTVADAQQVQLSDTLPPGVTFVSAALTNSPGTPFSAPAYSNNVVTTTAADFGSNSVVALAITVMPAVAGTLTNVVTVSSSTTDLDPTGNNHTATVITSVVAPTAPAAATALIVTVQATPAATVPVGNQLLYTVTLTNTVANAANVQLVDTLPPSVDFISASVSNPPGGTFSQPVLSNGAVTTVTTGATAFASNSAVVLFITVSPTVAGILTNLANVTSTTANLAPTSVLSASVTTAATVVVTNVPPLTNVTVQAVGPITFNPQTGLYQQSVLFTNPSGVAVSAVRVTVPGLPSSVTLYNATGSTNGAPYVEYDQTIAAGGGVVFLLEYYEASRQPFAATNFVATAVAAATTSAPNGTVLQLDRVAFLSEGQLTIEFAGIPGRTYVVQYSADINLRSWQSAAPPIVATGTKTQWTDSGPPKTVSPPGAPGQRFYRVVQTN